MAEETNNVKRKKDYHLMLFIDNENGEIKQMGIGRKFIEVVAGILLLILTIAIVGWIVSGVGKSHAKTENKELQKQVEELTTTNEELLKENDELNNKVTVLSNTVNAKVEQESEQIEQLEEAHLPEGFPLSSSASMTTSEEDPNVVLFTCSSGANIIATGAGVISSVIPDAEYGYCIQIDHDNGYMTEYYNASTPLVREGTEVLEGSILYVVEDGNDKMAYKVLLDGKYIDPMTIIKIDG